MILIAWYQIKYDYYWTQYAFCHKIIVHLYRRHITQNAIIFSIVSQDIFTACVCIVCPHRNPRRCLILHPRTNTVYYSLHILIFVFIIGNNIKNVPTIVPKWCILWVTLLEIGDFSLLISLFRSFFWLNQK